MDEVIKQLQKGNLACFPTETVYALAGNALDPEVVKKIFDIKKRPFNKALSIFVNEKNSITKYALQTSISTRLIDQFMPGAITIILPLKKDILPTEFFKDTIAIRIPNHPIALDILSKNKLSHSCH